MKRGTTRPSDLRFTAQVLRLLKIKFGPLQFPLRYRQPHELAVAVILSARCTDEQVNRVTPALFARYPDLESLGRARLGDLESLIYSVGFYRSKARSISGFSRMLLDEFEGLIPGELKKLERLPGVGRKSANVIQHQLHGVAEGIVVDTHVGRLARVLKLSSHSDPRRIESDLLERISHENRIPWSHYMIRLGRFCCRARKRECSICPVNRICPSAFKAIGRLND